MTEGEYGARKLALSKALGEAEGHVQAAIHAQSTGAGTPSATRSAKDKLADLKEQLSDLESLRLTARKQAATDTTATKIADFDAFLSDVDGMLAERPGLIEEAVDGIKRAMAAVARYREIDSVILRRASGLGNLSGSASNNATSGLAAVGLDVASQAVSRELAIARFASAGMSAADIAADLQRDRAIAANIRRSVLAFAPETWVGEA